MKSYLVVPVLWSFVGCSVLEQNAGDMGLQASQAQNATASVSAANLDIIPNSDAPQTITKPFDEQSLSINGVKMRVAKMPLGMGSRVFNLKTNSWGTIKGSITVVMGVGNSVNQLDGLTMFKLEKIAEDTYQLLPINYTGDLYGIYRELLNNTGVKVVELDVFYNGIIPKQEM